MIRQAISCDICGAEKKQTNHWFIAWEHDGELRVTGWTSRARLRAGAKHLCGQACLHKLADEFMEHILSRRAQTGTAEEQQPALPAPTDTSLTTATDYGDFESSARLIPPPPAVAARSMTRPAAALVAMPERLPTETPSAPPQDPPRYASRSWHAEAWQRERERNLQDSGHRPEVLNRRISQA